MRHPKLRPHIYVASLSDYNAGRLHGVWIDLEGVDIDSVWVTVRAMLDGSPEPGAEEIAIQDSEGFGPFRVDEYVALETVVTVARGICRHGEAFACWAAMWDQQDPDELDRFEDMYLGSFDSVRDHAEELLDGLGIDTDPEHWAPEIIAPYVRLDVDAFAGSLEYQYRIFEGETQVHFFEP